MKKLSFALALILVCGALAACGGDSDGTTAPKGSSSNPPKQSDSSKAPAKTTQKPATTKPGTGGADTTKPAQTTQPKEDEEQPKDELIDGTKFTVDGDLSEWNGLATLKLQGEASTANKNITYYGAMTTTGLYLAFDVYHDLYATGRPEWEWWENTNCEMYINSSSSVYAYATGMNSNCKTGANPNSGCQITQAVMKTTEINGDTKYHSTFEAFFAIEHLPEYAVYQNTVSVAIAWKTPSDLIIGGQYHANGDGSDDFWVVKSGDVQTFPLVATPKGLYRFDEYFTETE